MKIFSFEKIDLIEKKDRIGESYAIEEFRNWKTVYKLEKEMEDWLV